MSSEKNGEPVLDLADMFERGAVFADRWPTAVRVQLDVANPLTEAVRDALLARRHVVVAGAAGDGKSHLAMTVLDDWAPSAYYEVVAGANLPTGLARGTVVFLRDVSALAYDDVLSAIADAQSQSLTLLVTINEGPLDTLATKDHTGFLASVRDVIHQRSRGLDAVDPENATVINLNGRQLTRGDFVAGALAKILPVVRPCRTCGKAKTCPRVVGARELKRSKEAQVRVAKLLRMLTDRGRHLTAREIWTFLIDLFFGWTCGEVDNEVERQNGYFWSRVFAADNAVSEAIRSDFDHSRLPGRATMRTYGWATDPLPSLTPLPISSPGRTPTAGLKCSRARNGTSFSSAGSGTSTQPSLHSSPPAGSAGYSKGRPSATKSLPRWSGSSTLSDSAPRPRPTFGSAATTRSARTAGPKSSPPQERFPRARSRSGSPTLPIGACIRRATSSPTTCSCAGTTKIPSSSSTFRHGTNSKTTET